MQRAKLTPKQAKFIKAYTENGGNGTQASLQVYDTKDPRTAAMIASDNLTKPNIRDAIESAMTKAGLTPDKIAENLKNAAIAIPDKVDAHAMIKANVELLKLWGAYPGSKHTSLNLNIKGKMRDLSFQDAKLELDKLNSQLGEVIKEETSIEQ